MFAFFLFFKRAELTQFSHTKKKDQRGRAFAWRCNTLHFHREYLMWHYYYNCELGDKNMTIKVNKSVVREQLVTSPCSTHCT